MKIREQQIKRALDVLGVQRIFMGGFICLWWGCETGSQYSLKRAGRERGMARCLLFPENLAGEFQLFPERKLGLVSGEAFGLLFAHDE